MSRVEVKLGMMLILISAHPLTWIRGLGIQGGDSRPPATFVGQIMDSKCATVGSHEPMMKKLGAKDARDCTLRCAKDGSFVLYDPDTKTVYQLNDQEKPVRYAGQKVKISGTYDKWSQTIEVESINAADSDVLKFNSIRSHGFIRY
ncbi:MAG TPA: DUF5818 domain-containing protein [Candidatus Saccharimonadales bacterium]|jgi:hypothetical protein|nr:DUF5818 domain-containing protein [Candidatus Saccharimonadales bacterium]